MRSTTNLLHRRNVPSFEEEQLWCGVPQHTFRKIGRANNKNPWNNSFELIFHGHEEHSEAIEALSCRSLEESIQKNTIFRIE
jgi:hypothetical protein